MDLLVDTNINQFSHAVQAHLEQSEAENGLILGVMERARKEPPAVLPFMAQVRVNGQIQAVAFYTERNLIVSRGVGVFCLPIAQKLKDAAWDIPGVVGPAADAEEMAKVWSQVRGCPFQLGMNSRIYQLTEINWPTGIPGRARLVTEKDVDLLSSWFLAFQREALPLEPLSGAECRESAQARISAGMTFFWEVNGRPVTMAALSRPTTHGICVNLVYTPPESRRHGFASALVSFVSDEGLKRGKEFCVLYADLANPTSNAIYQRIGYRPVCDSTQYRFIY